MRNKVLVFIGISVLAAVLLLLLPKSDTRRFELPTHLPPPMLQGASTPDSNIGQTNRFIALQMQNRPHVRTVIEMTEDEKAEFAKVFDEQFKPAVEKWFKAYEGRVPFQLDDLTSDKFVERIGRNSSFYLYTFVFDGITFTIQDSDGKAKVFYMMTRKAAIEMNSLPGDGFVPDLSVPVNREEIIRMVRADSGVEFKPHEVIISPTGAACALNGGAFVSRRRPKQCS